MILKAALHKAFDFLEFQGFVADYKLLPEKLIKPFSATLIGLELGAVVMMLISATRTAGLLLACALFALYAIAMGINLLRGRTRIECGCGGTPQLLSPALIWRNAILMGAALLPLAGIRQNLAVMDILMVVAAGVFLWVLYSLLEQATVNFVSLTSKTM